MGMSEWTIIQVSYPIHHCLY